jgi:hypothetical protein
MRASIMTAFAVLAFILGSLASALHPTPGGARANDISGDVRVGNQVLEDWGLHLIDANLNMGPS